MKIVCLIISFLTAAGINGFGESTGPRSNIGILDERVPLQITERGPHHRVWSRVTQETNQLGRVTSRTNSYTELATGMYYWQDGQWKETLEKIEAFPDGAVAQNGSHKVIFAININSAGAIDMALPDGKRLRSHVLGLSYFDAATGKSVLIAELKDSSGSILQPNQVIYSDAFTDLHADVRYTYRRSGLEQDVILREAPPAPEEFGLDSRTTRLQVLTEFESPTQP